ncbi:Glucose-6-phosphate isomerase [Dirofilaria immitis]
MSKRNIQEDNSLMEAMRVANETLAKIEQRERNFYKTYGRHENDFLNDFISVSKQHERFISKFMKRFDQSISNVNVQLKILQAKTLESYSNQATALYSKTSGLAKLSTSKINEENLPSDSSTIDLLSKEQDDSNQLAEINYELTELEQRIFNIEMRMQEDIEAEEIGIEFPVSDIIDYMTAIKVTMYKRHMLTNQFHQIILNDENFEEEAKLLTKDFAIWTKEEREDLLTKMAQLEESLSKLQQFPLIYGDEFNRRYPLMADLNHLKHLVSWFLDKYEINSSEVSTARLTPSFSSYQPRQKKQIQKIK